MISKECFTTGWIDEKSIELQYKDKNIIEKVIRGISRIKSFMFRGSYFIDNAIVDASRAAYLVTLLEKGQTEIERYDGNPMSIASLDINPVLTNKLNKLKRQSPEAYFYWAKTSHLLG